MASAQFFNSTPSASTCTSRQLRSSRKLKYPSQKSQAITPSAQFASEQPLSKNPSSLRKIRPSRSFSIPSNSQTTASKTIPKRKATTLSNKEEKDFTEKSKRHKPSPRCAETSLPGREQKDHTTNTEIVSPDPTHTGTETLENTTSQFPNDLLSSGSSRSIESEQNVSGPSTTKGFLTDSSVVLVKLKYHAKQLGRQHLLFCEPFSFPCPKSSPRANRAPDHLWNLAKDELRKEWSFSDTISRWDKDAQITVRS